MILVDLQIPVLDRIYDFELDEEKEVKTLIQEIISLIQEKENLKDMGEKQLYLYAVRVGCVIRGDAGLAAQGIKNGDRLILI